MTTSMAGQFFAFTVKPENRDAFLAESILAAQNVTSAETEVFQFHIHVDASNRNRFYFYEVYRDEAALENHRQAAAFTNWWNNVRHMLDGDAEQIAHMQSVFPTPKGFEAQKPGLLQW